MSDEVGYGEEPSSADLVWQATADAFTPDKSLTRISAQARATVSTVAVVGTALTALGLVSVTSLLTAPVTRWFGTAAALLALLAVLASVAFLGLRLERLNIEDLDEVKRWYGRQFRRSYLAVAGSWLLLAAVVCAGIAAGTALWVSARGQDVGVNAQVSGTGAERSVKVSGTVTGLADDDALETTVLALAGDRCPETVLLRVTSQARRTGEVVLDGTAAKVPPCSTAFRLDVRRGTDQLATIPFH